MFDTEKILYNIINEIHFLENEFETPSITFDVLEYCKDNNNDISKIILLTLKPERDKLFEETRNWLKDYSFCADSLYHTYKLSYLYKLIDRMNYYRNDNNIVNDFCKKLDIDSEYIKNSVIPYVKKKLLVGMNRLVNEIYEELKSKEKEEF